MSKQLHWSAQLAVVFGFIGLFVMPLSFWAGAILILIGFATPLVAHRHAQKKTTPMPVTIDAQKRMATFLHSEQQCDKGKINVLTSVLRQNHLPVNAPVICTGATDADAITVRDILIEMIEIADAHGQPIDELAKDIVAMYDKIYSNVDNAIAQNLDAHFTAIYLARKAMIDVQWDLDKDLASISQFLAK